MNTGLDLPAVILLCKIKAEEALISFRCFQASLNEGAGLKKGCTELLGTASACFKHIPPPGSYCNCWRVNNIYSVLLSQNIWCIQKMERTTWLLFESTPLSSSFPGISSLWLGIFPTSASACVSWVCGCLLFWAFCSTILPLPELLSSLITLPLVPLDLHSFHTLLLMILVHLSFI